MSFKLISYCLLENKNLIHFRTALRHSVDAEICPANQIEVSENTSLIALYHLKGVCLFFNARYFIRLPP